MKTWEPKWKCCTPLLPGVTISDHVPGMERCRLVIVMSPVHSVAMVTLCRERTLPGHWGLHWNVHWEGELCDAFNAAAAVPELRMRRGDLLCPGQAMAWSGLHLYPQQNKEWMESPLWHHLVLSIFSWHPVSTLLYTLCCVWHPGWADPAISITLKTNGRMNNTLTLGCRVSGGGGQISRPSLGCN